VCSRVRRFKPEETVESEDSLSGAPINYSDDGTSWPESVAGMKPALSTYWAADETKVMWQNAACLLHLSVRDSIGARPTFGLSDWHGTESVAKARPDLTCAVGRGSKLWLSQSERSNRNSSMIKEALWPKAGDITQGFNQLDQTADPRFSIEFFDPPKTIEGEREVKDLILEILDFKPDASVLEVGCGTGNDVREIASHVGPTGQVVGIDSSEALIAESKRRASGSNLPVEFRLGDVRQLDFPNGTFNRVRTDRVLMFVPEIEAAIGEMVRVLRPGGRLFTCELDHELRFVDSRLPEINREIHAAWVANNPQPCIGRQLSRLLADQGLRNVKSRVQVIQPLYQMFARLTGGFLSTALEARRIGRSGS
jgi:ubiquinone/menaquinone biosynthesis C-methylase UbiE